MNFRITKNFSTFQLTPEKYFDGFVIAKFTKLLILQFDSCQKYIFLNFDWKLKIKIVTALISTIFSRPETVNLGGFIIVKFWKILILEFDSCQRLLLYTFLWFNEKFNIKIATILILESFIGYQRGILAIAKFWKFYF